MPTYNRAKLLESLLERIVKSIKNYDLETEVEVLVADNCSTDSTPAVLSKFLKFGVKSFRHSSNLGPDGNFLSLFEAARGDYTWLLGDDDVFKEDLLDSILSAISEYDVDYLYLRKSVTATGGPRNFKSISSRDLLNRSGINITFITSQIIRSKLIKEQLTTAKPFAQGMAYFLVFLNALYVSKVCLVTSRREIFPDKTGNTGGYKFYKVWGEMSNDMFRLSFFGEDKKLVSRFRTDIFLYMILPMTFYFSRSDRSNFKFSTEDPINGLSKYYGQPLFRAIFFAYKNSKGSLLVAVHLPIKILSILRRQFQKVEA